MRNAREGTAGDVWLEMIGLKARRLDQRESVGESGQTGGGGERERNCQDQRLPSGIFALGDRDGTGG